MLVRRSRRALTLWTAAGIATLVAVRVVAGDLATLHQRARASGPEVGAVVATHDLPLGHTIGAGDVEGVDRYRGHLPEGALLDPDRASGRVVTVPVLEGGILTERHLGASDRDGLDGVVPEGMRAVRVVVEDAPPVAGGSVVDVLVTFDPRVVPPEIEATTTVVEGAVVVGADDGGDRAGPDARGVTLLVDEAAARRLAFATANGIVTLALAPPEEACCPKPSSTPSSASSKD